MTTERRTKESGLSSPVLQRTAVFSAAVLLLVAGGGLAYATGAASRPGRTQPAIIVSQRPVEPVAASPSVPVTGPEEETTAAKPGAQASSSDSRPSRAAKPTSRPGSGDSKHKKKAEKRASEDDDEHETVKPPVRDNDDDDDDERETVAPPVRDEDEDPDDD